LLKAPELATSGTELARERNTELMARLNTRDQKGKLRLLTGNGNIFPNGDVIFMSYSELFPPTGDPTPGNLVLKQELQKAVGKGVTVPARPNFDDNTIDLLDKNQGVFTDAQLVQLAKILKLDTSPPSAAVQAQRAQEEAEAFDQPVPD
jgi:hypothetical protein